MTAASVEHPEGGLVEVGRRLREARVKRGWSIQQVAERIHVAIRYLDAIENGDPAGVPAEVYLRGFIMNYVRVLGLDETAILKLLDEGAKAISAEPMRVSPTSRAAAREKARVSMSPDWRRNLVIVAAVVVAGVIVGLSIRGISGLFSVKGENSAPPSPFENTGSSASGKAVDSRTPDLATKSAGLRQVMVSVTAIQDCWMQAQVDDGKTTDMDLKPGDTRYFAGTARVRLFIGNASGIYVSGPQGPVVMPTKPKTVVHFLFTRNGMERLKMPISPLPSSTTAQ